MLPRSIRYLILMMVIIAAIWPFVLGCQKETANASMAPPPPVVTVSAPQVRSITHYLDFTGTTVAAETVDIRARVEGYLQEIHFSSGAMVKKGDLLFTIDDRPFQANLKEAKAEQAIREAERELARVTANRKENALLDRAVSEVEVIEARAQLGIADAAVEAAAAMVRTAELDLSYTRITAPLSGRIGRNLVDTGNLVGANERTLLATIVKDDPIHTYFTVSERDWLQYRLNRPLSEKGKGTPSASGKVVGAGDQSGSKYDQLSVFLGLAGENDHPFQGHLDFIDNRVDSETGTIQVRGIFTNPDHLLLPGLYARVRIAVGETPEALLVPDTAIGRDQQGRFLLLVDPENKVRYSPITMGTLIGGMREITSGLKAGEQVIVNGIQKVRPGTPVTPQVADSPDASPQNEAPPATS